jgi:DNA polymerase-4
VSTPVADQRQRWVLHLDMDAFFASVEQLTRPTLRGRPVLVGGTGPRGVVAGASYEARAFGASSAMPMRQARKLVGSSAVVLPPRFVVYKLVSERVFTLVREVVPVLELVALDEAFGEPAELAGASVAEVESFCLALRARLLTETGLVASVGGGSGKQLAKIASRLAKPDGLLVVTPGTERTFLAPLPIRWIWGIGPVAEAKLRRLGVDTIGGLAAMCGAEISSLLGQAAGASLLRLACGVDDRPVAERGEVKQISEETTFPTDLVTAADLRSAVRASAEATHLRLAADGRAARTVVLKLRTADMRTVTRSKTLPHATADKLTLVAIAQRLLPDPAELGSIRLVGVAMAGLSRVQQGVLFPGLDGGAAEDARPDQPQDVAWNGPSIGWWVGRDVRHPEHGHGWVQGVGGGVVTVRFETRTSGPGPTRSFPEDDPILRPGDPAASLRW